MKESHLTAFVDAIELQLSESDLTQLDEASKY
jgi:hypothetical protein